MMVSECCFFIAKLKLSCFLPTYFHVAFCRNAARAWGNSTPVILMHAKTAPSGLCYLKRFPRPSSKKPVCS